MSQELLKQHESKQCYLLKWWIGKTQNRRISTGQKGRIRTEQNILEKVCLFGYLVMFIKLVRQSNIVGIETLSLLIL